MTSVSLTVLFSSLVAMVFHFPPTCCWADQTVGDLNTRLRLAHGGDLRVTRELGLPADSLVVHPLDRFVVDAPVFFPLCGTTLRHERFHSLDVGVGALVRVTESERSIDELSRGGLDLGNRLGRISRRGGRRGRGQRCLGGRTGRSCRRSRQAALSVGPSPASTQHRHRAIPVRRGRSSSTCSEGVASFNVERGGIPAYAGRRTRDALTVPRPGLASLTIWSRGR